MDKNKYLVGFIGLAVGFTISFLLTTNYNKSNAPAATAQSPSMPGANQAGSAGNQQAQMAQVQAILAKAKNNPKDAEAQVQAAQVQYQIGKLKEATEYLQKAYEIEPNNFGYAANLGFLYSDQKNYDESEKYLRRAVQIKPDEADVYVELGATLIQRQPPEPDKAIQEIQHALKINPKDAHALGHLVEAHALKKDARGAEEALNNLKETDPSNQRLAALQNMVADLKAGKPVTIPKE